MRNSVVKMEEETNCEENEGNFYSESYLEESMEDDEISSEEEGFMFGYLR